MLAEACVGVEEDGIGAVARHRRWRQGIAQLPFAEEVGDGFQPGFGLEVFPGDGFARFAGAGIRLRRQEGQGADRG